MVEHGSLLGKFTGFAMVVQEVFWKCRRKYALGLLVEAVEGGVQRNGLFLLVKWCCLVVFLSLRFFSFEFS